ncbi:MAG: hypothetical protein JNK12_20485 [Acidimicrobiales bacterium]|nr:hypothetical protein [Acidimicrobiales bacterium]
MTTTTRARFGALLCATILAASCSSDSGSDNSGAVADESTSPIIAQVASYDLTTELPQRVIVGLLDNDNNVVSYGDVEFAFSYLGTADEPLDTPDQGPRAIADFRPIPGQDIDLDTPGPRIGQPSDGAGIYAADDVEFADAGIWEVAVTADLPDGEATATANFEVVAESDIPNIGDAAPRTENLLPGDSDAPVDAIDSRAEPDGTVPDPDLHTETVAQAIATGRPALVVVSTPTFCVSRFCGPITDSVAALAAETGDEVAFIHIEVWRDYENTVLNQGAADWIWPSEEGDDIHEPWVFLVGADGTIIERWDNVATDAEMQAAIDQVRS